MGALDMGGTIDLVFRSVPATRTTTPGSYVDGIWTPGTATTLSYTVNIQPVSPQELDFLSQGGERNVDLRRVYVNSGDMQSIDTTGTWEFLGLKWKTVQLDNRYWRSYVKIIVQREDNQ